MDPNYISRNPLESEVVYESQGGAAVIRSKTFDQSLQEQDLSGPFFIAYFVAVWLFVIFVGYVRGVRTAVVAFILLALLC